ncbi:type VII secretion-associated protein [Actinophytocola xanthii]|uniref:Type VII secretion-associated protein n=1 Tax=Actinophytocola xanthii TaxID=1912961 RepID=A0A1Q8CMQ7_9PSEU|nr:type VII secretion-associated protein [Actinophytocola xanthii]OLF15643.1 type VII secretion-associated protein [Actinophytocola xanthii]
MSADGREPQVVAIDGHPLMPSAVYAAPDGTLFVGQEADRHAAVDPSRYEPHPKRRIDEKELLLGATVVPVREVVRAVLARAVAEARRLAGNAVVDQLVLTHPADWGAVRTTALRQAANGLGRRIVLVPEPVAAAVFHAASFPVAPVAGVPPSLAVLDLGGGTVDVSVVRPAAGPRPPAGRAGPAFHVLATRGDPTFGGADVDQLLLEHVGSVVARVDQDAWRALIEGRELPDRRRRRVIHQDVRGAKETLSRHTYTDVPMPPPFPDVHVTRDDLEKLITDPVQRVAELTVATIRESRLAPTELAGIFLVGGSSRIPLVSRLVHQRAGVVPVTLDQPETVVARGALRAAAGDGERTGLLPAGRRAPAEEAIRPIAAAPGGRQGPGVDGGPVLGAVPGALPGPVAGRAEGRPAVPGAAAGPVAEGTPLPGGSRGLGEEPGRPPGPAGVPGLAPSSVGPPGPVAGPPIPAAAPPPRSSGRRWLVGTAVLLAVAVVVTVVVLVATQGDGTAPEGGNTSAGSPDSSPSRVIAQYEYQFALPEGWLQTGGDPELLRTELKPEGREQGEDRVLVEQIRLAFDSTDDRARAVDRLRAEFERADGSFSDFDENATFAGREVIHYRERLGEADVDWYVLFDGRAQVSVGCQYGSDGSRYEVETACRTVVRSLTVIE